MTKFERSARHTQRCSQGLRPLDSCSRAVALGIGAGAELPVLYIYMERVAHGARSLSTRIGRTLGLRQREVRS